MKARLLSGEEFAADYAAAVKARTALFETLCEVDEPFLERYLAVTGTCDDASLLLDDLLAVHQAIRRATIALKVREAVRGRCDAHWRS